ncbi:MAG: hypothetical protein H6963_11680 [Chromatiaceae bacterium]|nr:hypothetical protein [Chromatiaceae bacterium]
MIQGEKVHAGGPVTLLDAVNPGAWFGKQFAGLLDAEKVLTQKSGYYSRAAASNAADLKLIKECCDKAVECAMAGIGGVIGQDDDQDHELRAIEFPRIAGGKPFDIDTDWFTGLLQEIGQSKGRKVTVAH